MLNLTAAAMDCTFLGSQAARCGVAAGARVAHGCSARTSPGLRSERGRKVARRFPAASTFSANVATVSD